MKNKQAHLDRYTPLAGNEDYTDNAWTNNEAAEDRYEAVAALLQQLGCKSVADYGCGTGHLSNFTGNLPYQGFDMTPAFVAKGREIYGANITLVDGQSIPEFKADAVVCIGTYSMRMDEDSETYAKFVEDQIRVLMGRAERYLVLVGFRKLNDFEDDHLFYTDVDSLLRLADDMGVIVTINNLIRHNFIAIFDKNTFKF